MTKLDWVALFAAANILILVILMFRVVSARRRHKVTLGDGGNPAVLQAVRAHGNASEYMGLALLGLALIAFQDPIPLPSVIGLGSVFTVGRALHAIGLSGNPGPSFGRVTGTILTLFALLGIAAALAYGALAPLL